MKKSAIALSLSLLLSLLLLSLPLQCFADGKLLFLYNGREIPFLESGRAVCLEINGERICAPYQNLGAGAGADRIIDLSDRADGADVSKAAAAAGAAEAVTCVAKITTRHGSQISVTDTYTPRGKGVVGLHRVLEVARAASGDSSLVSFFGFAPASGDGGDRGDDGDGGDGGDGAAGANAITANEFLVPGVWYKSNFIPEANLPGNVPQAGDRCFLYRSDRITLPMVMFRDPRSGFTLTIIHENSVPDTVMADSQGAGARSARKGGKGGKSGDGGDGIVINKGFQYSSIGALRETETGFSGGTTSVSSGSMPAIEESSGRHGGRPSTDTRDRLFIGLAYPGTEMDRRDGSGPRAHPVATGLRHTYDVEIAVSTTHDYASAARQAWERAFTLYNPPVLTVPLRTVYDGLVKTLLTYYCPSRALGGRYDAPGFPFQVNLADFKVMGVNYQMGFVGMQIPTGYCLYREGINTKNSATAAKGEAVLDFWASSCLTKLGYPRAWYDPGLDGKTGRFRKMGNIRTATGGMEALTSAWCFAKRHGVNKPAWLNASVRFGEWLLKNQNADGSWYLSYDHNVIDANGRHPPVIRNKYATTCALRFLAELHIATGRADFRDALLRAGEFCLRNVSDKYVYATCVVDNPQTLDSESGQMALNGFLALYDLTHDKKWLAAAEQAALYTATWTYMFDIPVERDHARGDPLVAPADRSMVGQHLIAIRHSGADLGFAWSSFAYYRLWLETGDALWQRLARIAAHDTKQTMNWDGTLYPGQPRGLQLEAFRIMVPRRGRGVLHCLNWNYAAHLDPMMRFEDAFGTVDLEAVERMDAGQRARLNETYAEVQSADWGQRRK